MEPRVVEDTARRRFEIYLDGELAGWTAYARLGDAYVFTHTEIDERFKGQGLGSILIRSVLDTMRERGHAVVPLCPFVRRYMTDHSEYHDLVPEQLRDALRASAAG